MIKFFRNLSIKYKLTLILFISSLIVSSIGLGLVLIQDRQRLIEETINDAKEEVKMLSQEFVKIILYGNIDLSADVASKLATFQLTEHCFLFDENREVIFSYHKKGLNKIPPPEMLQQYARYEENHFHIFLPVTYLGKEYGTVYYQVSNSRLFEQIRNYYFAVSAIIPFVALCSFLLALWLQRYFTSPVITLTRELTKIAESHDYTKRVSVNSKDEFGELYSKYNHLLEEIQARQRNIFDSEQRLAGIIDIAGSAIISIDNSQQIILFNKKAEEIFGYSADSVIGKSIDTLIPARFRSQHSEKVVNFGVSNCNASAKIARPEIIALRENGEEFVVNASISKGEFGGNEIFTVALDDITEIKKKEKEIQIYQEHLEELVAKRTAELEATNKELESYSYSIAHDLRAPLRSITSFSQILFDDIKGRLSSEETDLINRVIRASKHMAKLIDDILQLSKISRGHIQSRTVDLSRLCESILLRYQEHSPERNVKWKIQTGLIVNGDPSLLEVMLENLLGNAWKFTSEEPLSEIEIGMTVQNNRNTYFIEDNGVGFDMKYSDKVFGEFQRLHNSASYEGTGIGLATVKRIVARHGGTVWVDAQEGKGARFYFTL